MNCSAKKLILNSVLTETCVAKEINKGKVLKTAIKTMNGGENNATKMIFFSHNSG